MGKLDELKSHIDWLGRWLNVFIVTDFALIGWLALNYEAQKLVIVYSALFGILFFTVAIVVINANAIKKIREMRNLKK